MFTVERQIPAANTKRIWSELKLTNERRSPNRFYMTVILGLLLGKMSNPKGTNQYVVRCTESKNKCLADLSKAGYSLKLLWPHLWHWQRHFFQSIITSFKVWTWPPKVSVFHLTLAHVLGEKLLLSLGVKSIRFEFDCNFFFVASSTFCICKPAAYSHTHTHTLEHAQPCVPLGR